MSEPAMTPIKAAAEPSRSETPEQSRFDRLLAGLSDWRNADHEDSLALWRTDIIEIIEGVKALRLAAAPAGTTPKPFYGAECPAYPACDGGCGLGCTKEIERTRASAPAGNDGVRKQAYEIARHVIGHLEGNCGLSFADVKQNDWDTLTNLIAAKARADGTFSTAPFVKDQAHRERIEKGEAVLPSYPVTDGLVERLRNWPATAPRKDAFSSHFVGALLNDAAAEIDRLCGVAQPPTETLPTHGGLLTEINRAAHSAGTNAWVRDVLKRAHRAIRDLAPVVSSTDREGGK